LTGFSGVGAYCYRSRNSREKKNGRFTALSRRLLFSQLLPIMGEAHLQRREKVKLIGWLKIKPC